MVINPRAAGSGAGGKSKLLKMDLCGTVSLVSFSPSSLKLIQVLICVQKRDLSLRLALSESPGPDRGRLCSDNYGLPLPL